MRYTTIIDITEFGEVYRSVACRMVYLHLCLKAGYHDYDRDMATCSLRSIAADTGLTLSAVRCAVSRLERLHLVLREGTALRVKKYILEENITPRPRTRKQKQQQDAASIRTQQQEQMERQRESERRETDELRKQGKTSYMLYYEEKMKLAAAGDTEAQRIVDRGRSIYEAHAEQMRKEASHDQ